MKKKKLLLRNLILFNENIQNRNKLLKFKRNKWKLLHSKLNDNKIQNALIFKNNKAEKKLTINKKLHDQLIFQTPTFYNKILKGSMKSKLRSKQRLQFFYGGISKTYLKLLKNGSIKHYILKTLESRLDFILYKAGFGFTVIETKNLIMHGHVFLNEKNILDPKTQIKKGDHIKIKNSNNIKNKIFKIKPTIENGVTINYMHINYKIFEIVIIKDLHLSNTIQNFNFYLKLGDL